MRYISYLLGLVFLASTVFAGTATADTTESVKEITIGFTPSGNPENLREGAVIVAAQLQEALKIPINIYIAKNYVGLIEAMKEKKVDFAFYSSLSFVLAEQQAHAKVLLKKVWNEPFYHATILVSAKSKLKNIKDIKKNQITFVDQNSTSGYLYPILAVKKAKVTWWNDKDVSFSGSHSESVNRLIEGKTEAIAVFSDSGDGKLNAFKKYKPNFSGKNPKVIWTSKPIPNDPLAVREDFYNANPKTTHNLMLALIDIGDKLKSNPKVREILNEKGFMLSTSRQYDPVREVVKELGWKIEGN